METNFRGHELDKNIKNQNLDKLSAKDLEQEADENSMKVRRQSKSNDDGKVDRENIQVFSASDHTAEKQWSDETNPG